MNLNELADYWNRLFPGYPASLVSSQVIIRETDAGAIFNQLEIHTALFLSFQTTIVKDLSGFFTKAVTDKSLNKDCDGAVIFEYDNQFYMFLVELKSSFDTQQISKARQQITSTYIKLNALLNMIDGYEKTQIKFRGIIACLAPDTDKLDWISKMEMLPDPEKGVHLFALNLYLNKTRIVSAADCREVSSLPLSGSCMYNTLPFYYCEATGCSLNIDLINYL